MKTFGRALALMTMLVSCVFVAPTLAFADPTVYPVGNDDEFKDAVADINVNGKTGEDYVIKLTDDFESNGATFSSDCTTTILGNGHTITFPHREASLSVQKGSRLNLGSTDGRDVLTIKGGSEQNNDAPGLLYIMGSCDMYAGVTLANRQGNNYFGGGVTVYGGTFHMYGGTIENCGLKDGSLCYGGGVGVVRGGSFVMDNGEIKNCYADSDFALGGIPQALGGGVCVTGGSSFVMNGGSISNNRATGEGGGVAVVASLSEKVDGSRAIKSYVELNGGTIDGNTAGDGAGVFMSAGYGALTAGLWTGTSSAAAAEKQGLHIGGVSITGNKAGEQGCSGGGVLVFDAGKLATVSIDGATISGNSAAQGGGLAAYASSDMDAITVTNTVLCNNTASTSGADICTARTKVSLSSARDMGENYLGAPDDVYGSRIDGWYVDNEGSRYASQQVGERQAFGDRVSIGASDSVSLVAASNNRLVKVSFTNEDGSVTYGEGWYESGTKADQIQVPKPAKDSDDTFDYKFAGWDSEIADVTVETVYKAQFNRLFKVFGARYEFQSATPGQQLPDEVLALLPADGTRYPRGSEIGALAPSQTSVETADGTWTFVGYDRTTAEASMDNADNEGNVHFSGAWKFTRKATPAQPGNGGATAGANPAGKADGASSEGAQLPQTSDAFDPGALLALIAAGATSLIVAAAIRE